MENKLQKKRLSWDIISDYRGVLMGISIISIMIFHYTDDCLIFKTGFTGWKVFYNTYISSSSVEPFLLLSGFGLYFSMKKNPSLQNFFKKRFSRILIPYFIVAIPAWLWKDIFFKKLGFKVFFKDLFFITFFENGQKWFYYVFLMAFCYLIFPYIFRIVESCPDEETEDMRMMSLFTFSTLLSLLIQDCCKDLFGYINIALLRIPVFCFGCFIGKRAYEKRSIRPGVYVLMIASIFLAQLRTVNRVVIVRYTLGLLNLSICFLIVLILRKIKKLTKLHKAICKFFEWFGKYSLELYLTHIALRSIYANYGHPNCNTKSELVMVASAIILSVIVKLLTNLITNIRIPSVYRTN